MYARILHSDDRKAICTSKRTHNVDSNRNTFLMGITSSYYIEIELVCASCGAVDVTTPVREKKHRQQQQKKTKKQKRNTKISQN